MLSAIVPAIGHADTASASDDGKRVAGAPAVVVQGGTPESLQGNVPVATAVQYETDVLRAEQWEQDRSGDIILAIPVISSTIDEWLQDTDKVIEIRYPGGEEGEFWVRELTDWLIALGIPEDRLLATPGSGGDDIIRFHLSHAY